MVCRREARSAAEGTATSLLKSRAIAGRSPRAFVSIRAVACCGSVRKTAGDLDQRPLTGTQARIIGGTEGGGLVQPPCSRAWLYSQESLAHTYEEKRSNI